MNRAMRLYFHKRDWLFFPILLICYILPIDFFKQIGISIDNIVFTIYFLLTLFWFYAKNNWIINLSDLLFIVYVLFIVFLKKEVTFLHLISLVWIDKLLNYKDDIQRFFKEGSGKFFCWISILFCILYSGLYFGYNNRYLFTGIKEPNESGLSLFMLFLLIRFYSRKIGNLLLILGVLTFSKSYLLGIVVFFVTTFLVKYFKSIKIHKLFNFFAIMLISCSVLIVLAELFTVYARNGLLQPYVETGLDRFTTFMDTSNYFRFSVNKNLLMIYTQKPTYLLTGIGTEEFLLENLMITRQMGGEFRAIKPHNYFFSYLQIYGFFAIYVFIYVGKMLNKIKNNRNLPIYLSSYLFAIFLGLGLNSYWLLLTVLVMIVYGSENE